MHDERFINGNQKGNKFFRSMQPRRLFIQMEEQKQCNGGAKVTFLSIGDSIFDDIQEFISFLEYDKKGSRLPSNLQIVATISTFETINEFIDNLVKLGFIIEKRYGKLLLISKSINDRKIYYYAFFDDRNNVPLFLTSARKTDDIPETLLDYIKRARDISNLWITPRIMRELKDRLIEEHSDLIITYFSAKRTPDSNIRAEYRPEISRGIQYQGIDGRQALDEMEFYYGVLPKILEIWLPNGVAFRIDNKGIITLLKGNFGNVFKIIESVIDKLITIRNAIGESNYTIYKVGINNQFTHMIQTPWSVILPTRMRLDDIPGFCRALSEEEWDFTVLEDMFLKESMFSARLIDNNNSSVFDIETSGDSIDIYPVEQADIGSYIKFYEFLVENVDSQAVVG